MSQEIHKILVVDDSEVVRVRIRNLLKDRPFMVFEAKDGLEALQKVKDISPHFITLDFEMPNLDGIETCKQLKEMPELKSVPIVMLTSVDNDQIKSAAFDAGISQYFTKKSIITLLVKYIDEYFNAKTTKPVDATIGIVDDSKVTSNIVDRLLMTSGYKTVVFHSGEEFLTCLDSSRGCDLMLVDLRLPKMSGFELIGKIREKYSMDRLPIIVMSGESEQTSKVEAFMQGANDYITKPFQRDELLARLGAHLQVSALQKTLIQQNVFLEDLNNTKNMFLGIAAHDLRNPLTIIKQSIDLMKEGVCEDPNDRKEVLRVMSAEANRMVSLLEDLLNLNRIESGKLEIHKETHNLEEFIRDIQSFNHLPAKKKNINLKVNNNIGATTVLFDVDKVIQVVNNFISNAIKYSNPESMVTVNFNQKQSTLNVQVIDQGQGIPDNEFDQVFKEFSKISTQPTQGEGSVGLGLSICKRIINAHGGDVGFTSKQGEGSNFFFDLHDCIFGQE